MKQKCIRCVVQLSLGQLTWLDGSGTSIHLEGPPVFLRACVLGQLHHSPLHRPLFPLTLHQDLTFDRVLTNCRNPALFNEVIRGEHVRIELIQVSEDYRGGKILARFECPAHKFLFPDPPPGSGETREIQLNKSRKYQCPPRLTYTTSTTLLEATVHSPVDSLFRLSDSTEETREEATSSVEQRSPSLTGTHEQRMHVPVSEDTSTRSQVSQRLFTSASQQRSLYTRGVFHKLPLEPRVAHHSAPFGTGDGISTQEKLHSLLDSYTEPLRLEGGEEREEDTRPFRVKFKPRVPKFCSAPAPRSTLGKAAVPEIAESRDVGSLYQSVSTGVGLHGWEDCPRRKERPLSSRRSRSAPSSPTRGCRKMKHSSCHHNRSATCMYVPNNVPIEALSLETADPALVPAKSAPDFRPPFVVRRTDPTLLAKRNFCGECEIGATKHFSRKEPQRHFVQSEVCAPTESGMETREPVYLNELQNADQFHPPTTAAYPTLGYLHKQKHLPSEQTVSHSPLSSALTHSHEPTTALEDCPYPYQPSYSSISLHQRGSLTPHYPPSLRRWPGSRDGGCDLVSKYLVAQPGNTRRGVMSPSKLIEEKLQRVMTECCECKHTSESLGEDSLSEDLERLRASLAGEREDALNKSARLIPDQSVTVKIGPRDYWSKRMAEFTGRPHRVLFGETLEKIYGRLYDEASRSHQL